MSNKTYEFEKLFENRNSIFSVLNKSGKELINKHFDIKLYRKGELIFREGERPAGLMILIKGKAKLYKKGVGKREQILKLLNSSGLIGYRALFADEKYTASARTLEDSSVFIVNREIIYQICENNPQFLIKLVKSIASELGISNNRLVSLTQKHIRGRIAESLIYLVELYGFENDKKTLNIKISRNDLANLSNMTISNAIRTLSSFADEGVLTLDRKKIRIDDLQKLKHISNLGW